MGRVWPLGALLGVLLEASWGVLEASWAILRPSWASWTDRSVARVPLGPSWGPFGTLLARLGAFLGPSKSRDKTPGAPGRMRRAQEDFGIWGPGPLKTLQDRGLRLRGLSKGPEDTPTRARGHGGGCGAIYVVQSVVQFLWCNLC